MWLHQDQDDLSPRDQHRHHHHLLRPGSSHGKFTKTLWPLTLNLPSNENNFSKIIFLKWFILHQRWRGDPTQPSYWFEIPHACWTVSQTCGFKILELNLSPTYLAWQTFHCELLYDLEMWGWHERERLERELCLEFYWYGSDLMVREMPLGKFWWWPNSVSTLGRCYQERDHNKLIQLSVQHSLSPAETSL